MLIYALFLLAFTASEGERTPIATSMPAFLGVGFAGFDDTGVVIGEVRPGSSAQKAGLLPGDVILSFHGQPIQQPEELRLAVLARQAGDKVELLIRRDGGEKTVKVTLGRPALPEEILLQRDPPRVNAGTIEGTGAHGGSLQSVGNLVLTGSMQVEENLKLGFGGVLDIPISDRANRPTLQVAGDVELSGMLYVAKSNLEFKAGDAFEIIHGAKSIKGGFNTLWLPPLPAGLRWHVDIDNLARGHDRDKDGKYDVTLVVVAK